MSVDDLQNKIKQKLGFLTSSVDTLKEHQKRLQENSDKARNYVHASCDRDLNSLKLKERNILRQIEVVTENQRRLLDLQISKLLQIKGSLHATQKILHECQYDNITALTSLYDGYVTSLKPVDDNSLNTLSVETLIESAVIAFRDLDIPDKFMQHNSPYVTSRLDDYEDSGRDILHKNLNENLSICGDESSAIKVHFPKMPSGGWLAKPPSECHIRGDKSHSGDLSERNQNQDMSCWLSSEEGSEGGKLGGSFEILDNENGNSLLPKKEKSRCSSFSSSIEVVSSLDMEKEMTCLPGNEFSNAKSCWLSISQSDNRKSTVDSCMAVDVEEFACQANEPCDSYKYCLCQGYCKDLAKERALQTSRWLLKNELEVGKTPSPIGEESLKEIPHHPTGIKRKLSPSDGGNEVLKHMKFILSSDQNKWLVSTALKKTLNGRESNPGRDTNILYKPRSEYWLSKLTKDSGNQTPEKQLTVRYSPHSNVWLLHKLKEQRKREQQNEKNRTTQEQDHENNVSPVEQGSLNNGVSVSDLRGALAELSILLPKYSPTGYTMGYPMGSSANSNTHTNNAFYTTMNPHASSVLTHNINYLYRNNDFDLTRKLKWLSRAPKGGSGPGEFRTQSAPNFLPISLKVLAERNLDKWLMNRL